MTSTEKFTQAIELRKKGLFEESRDSLWSLMGSDIEHGVIYLNIAWSYDNQGLEEKALHYYRQALDEPLSGDDYFEAKFGLACTYRCLGHFQEAERIFETLVRDYPSKTEILPFFALCLMSLGKKDAAFKLILALIVKHPPTEAISRYNAALIGYLDKL